MIIMISKSVQGKEKSKSGARNGRNVTEKKGRENGKEKMIEEGTGMIDQIEGAKNTRPVLARLSLYYKFGEKCFKNVILTVKILERIISFFTGFSFFNEFKLVLPHKSLVRLVR